MLITQRGWQWDKSDNSFKVEIISTPKCLIKKTSFINAAIWHEWKVK